jgi:hypothetical protein
MSQATDFFLVLEANVPTLLDAKVLSNWAGVLMADHNLTRNLRLFLHFRSDYLSHL